MRKTIRIVAISLSLTILIPMIIFAISLIGFGKPYNQIVQDVANLYGFSDHIILFELLNEVRTDDGKKVNGLYKTSIDIDGTPIHIISVRNSISRPIVIATIFHEFAHGIQIWNYLAIEADDRENHAERLAFYMMWHNGYRWYTIHLLFLHTLGLKSKEYNITSKAWETMFSSGFQRPGNLYLKIFNDNESHMNFNETISLPKLDGKHSYMFVIYAKSDISAGQLEIALNDEKIFPYFQILFQDNWQFCYLILRDVKDLEEVEISFTTWQLEWVPDESQESFKLVPVVPFLSIKFIKITLLPQHLISSQF